MLVRCGLVFDPHPRLWGKAHRQWLDGLVFENPIEQIVIAEFRLAACA